MNLSVRLPDQLIKDIEIFCHELNLSRNEYIKRSIIQMNQDIIRHKKQDHLKKLSLKVRQESMIVNQEFEEIDCATL